MKRLFPLTLFLAFIPGCARVPPVSRYEPPPEEVQPSSSERNYDIGRSSVEISPLDNPQEPLFAPKLSEPLPQEASLAGEKLSSQPRPPVPLVRNAFTGKWKIKEGSGTCSLSLSSVPKIDLYNASSKGCNTDALKRVIAWDLKGREIHLFQVGGALSARFMIDPEASSETFSGNLTSSGERIQLSR